MKKVFNIEKGQQTIQISLETSESFRSVESGLGNLYGIDEEVFDSILEKILHVLSNKVTLPSELYISLVDNPSLPNKKHKMGAFYFEVKDNNDTPVFSFGIGWPNDSVEVYPGRTVNIQQDSLVTVAFDGGKKQLLFDLSPARLSCMGDFTSYVEKLPSGILVERTVFYGDACIKVDFGEYVLSFAYLLNKKIDFEREASEEVSKLVDVLTGWTLEKPADELYRSLSEFVDSNSWVLSMKGKQKNGVSRSKYQGFRFVSEDGKLKSFVIPVSLFNEELTGTVTICGGYVAYEEAILGSVGEGDERSISIIGKSQITLEESGLFDISSRIDSPVSSNVQMFLVQKALAGFVDRGLYYIEEARRLLDALNKTTGKRKKS